MVRMLGFSDEDKQRIGIAQQGAGKGVVRGVLGLPGRLVGGIMGGGSAEAPTTMASEDQVVLSVTFSGSPYSLFGARLCTFYIYKKLFFKKLKLDI